MMKDEMQQELLKRVDLLAEKIGATGADLFQSYIGHVQIAPWTIFFGAIGFAIIAAILIKAAIAAHGCEKQERAKPREERNKYYKGGIYDGILLMGGIFGGICLLISLIMVGCFIGEIPNLFYPEKAAFKQFVEDIGRIK